VNGDNYPDILYAGQSQLTGILGGLKAAQSGIEGGYKVITKTEDFMNTKSIAFGPSEASQLEDLALSSEILLFHGRWGRDF
jgi:hypothetical protein